MTIGTRSDTLVVKPAIFHRSVERLLRDLPKAVRKELGDAILQLQEGELLGFPLSRPMPVVGSGVEELRVRGKQGSYRVFCLARMKDRVLIFHAFAKKADQTPQREIETGKRRLREMLHA